MGRWSIRHKGAHSPSIISVCRRLFGHLSFAPFRCIPKTPTLSPSLPLTSPELASKITSRSSPCPQPSILAPAIHTTHITMASPSSRPSMRTVLLACMLSCAPLLASAAAGEYAYFNDRDSGGGALYGGAPVWVKTPAQCAAACTADPNCFGWTLRIASGGGDGPCYLKGTIMCDANSLSKVQPAGQYASGIVGNQCDVKCSNTVVKVPNGVCAIVTPTPTSTKAAGRYKRDVEQRNARAAMSRLCPKGQTACPIGSSKDGYECVDLSEELESCGACGNDCSALPGTRDVACSKGVCLIGSCAPGFSLSIAGICKKAPKLAHRRSKGAAQAHIRRYTI